MQMRIKWCNGGTTCWQYVFKLFYSQLLMRWPIKAKIFVTLRCIKYFKKILFWNQLLPKQQFFLGNQNYLCKTPGNPLLTDLYPTMILWYNVDFQNSQFKRFATIATMSPWKPKMCIHDGKKMSKIDVLTKYLQIYCQGRNAIHISVTMLCLPLLLW